MAKPNWHDRMFYTAEECRRNAEREETLANAAQLDGDSTFKEMHRAHAREWREIARQKENS